MNTPKYRIFFGQSQVDNKKTAKNLPPDDFQAPPMPDLTPPGWTWDSEQVKFSSASRTFDEGYTVEQLIYLIANE